MNEPILENLLFSFNRSTKVEARKEHYRPTQKTSNIQSYDFKSILMNLPVFMQDE